MLVVEIHNAARPGAVPARTVVNHPVLTREKTQNEVPRSRLAYITSQFFSTQQINEEARKHDARRHC